MGLSEGGIQVIGPANYKDLVASMADSFERWGNRWLKFGFPAGWFAYFLRTESGQVLLPQCVKQLASAVDSIPDRDWHHNDLGALFTEVLSLCWKHCQKEVENDADLRTVFLHILAALCARQIPEALHLRSKVSGDSWRFLRSRERRPRRLGLMPVSDRDCFPASSPRRSSGSLQSD
jgi:hypothetical protein